MATLIRAFIALPLPTDLWAAIQDVTNALQRLPLRLRWVQPHQAHLTLKFLGDMPEAAIAPLGLALERALSGQAPFTLAVRALGCFPHPARPRVVWMGINDAAQVLTRLHQRLEAELQPFGLMPDEHPFHPHWTLARVPPQRHSTDHLTPLLRAYQDRAFGEIAVTQIQLFQSQLQRAGAVYTPLHAVTLSAQQG
jgi:2'-5' RNA ligase